MPLESQLIRILLLLVLTSPISSLGQSPRTCDEGKPFTAKMVENIVSTKPDGTERKVNSGGLWARDTSGRTYRELILDTNRPSPKTKSDRVLEGVGTSRENGLARKGPAIHSMVSISNCHTGEEITIFPDLKNFRVELGAFDPSWRRPHDEPLYEFLSSGARPANAMVEDLGFKEVEGISVHGYRETIIGTQDDGEWNGKIRWVMESWVSDDLAEVVQRTTSDFRSKTTTTIMLTEIKRDEPQETLFEIPGGFTAQRQIDKESPSGTPEPKSAN